MRERLKQGYRLLAIILPFFALLFIAPNVSAADQTDQEASVQAIELMDAPCDTIFSEFKLLIGSAEGAEFYDFLTPSDTMPDLETGTTYYLSVRFNKPSSVDAVKIRLGDLSGQIANGLYFISTPGNTTELGSITHSYFSKLLQYTDYANPTFGANASTTVGSAGTSSLPVEDGELIYQIANTVDTGSEIYFTLGFQINEAFNDNAGEILDAIGISLGTWDTSNNSFLANDNINYSPTLDFNLADRTGLKAYFNGTSKNADIGSKSEALVLNALVDQSSAIPAAALYDYVTFDLTYPSNVTIDKDDIMFNSSSKQYDEYYGVIDVDAEVDNGNGTTTRTVTVYNGY